MEIAGAHLNIGLCNECGIIYNVMPMHEQNKLQQLFQSDEYRYHDESHSIKTNATKEMVPKSKVQVQLLDPFIGNTTKLSVLDIGCFDGSFLGEINQIYDAELLLGFDVSQPISFPTSPPFEFTQTTISKINHEFDLIVFSHSLQYVEDLQNIFANIKCLLKPEGKIFIQIPDIMKKQSALSLGDQLYHFTPNTLRGLLNGFGFGSTIIENTFFPRDLLLVADQNPSKCEFNCYEDHKFVRTAINALVDLPSQLEIEKYDDRLGVFGTAIDAALIDSVCHQVAYFVDENPLKAGGKFRNCSIHHPSELCKTDIVLVPREMFQSALSDRLASQYKCQFLAAP
jgi:hypothetical protein